MKTLYKNAIVYDPELGVLGDQLTVDGECFAAIGQSEKEKSVPPDRTVDCGGGILMPSLTDAHTHLAMTIMRNTADDLKLRDWLYKRIFPMEDRLDEGLVRVGVRLGCAELIRNGVTTCVDMYMYPEVVREVLQSSGMEGVVCVGDNDMDGDAVGRLKRQEKNMAAATDRVRSMLSFHSIYTCSEDYLEGIMALSQETRTGVVCHNSETLEEVGTCCTRHNDLSPTMFMHSLGLLDFGGIMAHCVYCDKDDLALLKQCGCSVAINCASNLKLGSGVPPIVTMKDFGLNMSVGTDSAASNNRLDMWREMYLAAVLPKGTLNAPEAVSAQRVLQWATRGGAAAAGFDSGKLRIGTMANFILVATDAIGMTPLNDVAAALAYGAGAADVRMTVCRGQVLYADGRFQNGWNEAEILREAREASIELQKRLG